MGLFDFFKRGGAPIPANDSGKPVDRKFAKLSKAVCDKRGQTYDRDEAMDQLVAIGSPDAAGALLRRFDLKVDPSITDTDEKQRAFDCIVRIGHGDIGKRLADVGKPAKEIDDSPLTSDEKAELRDAVVEVTKTYCLWAENLSWPLKIIRDLLDYEPFQASVLELLSNFDTEYARNVQPKLNLLAALEDFKNDTVRLAVEPYLDDVNETVRFHAVETVCRQDDDTSLAPLLDMAEREESVRVKNKIASGLVGLGWTIPSELQERWREALTGTKFVLPTGGRVVRAR
jgi:hypothetical protein